MKYTYIYKTSDGIRREGAMDAPSRDEVFMALRKEGIRAIKVIAADGSKANGEIRGVRKRVVTLLVLLGILLTAGLSFYYFSRIPRDPASSAAVTRLNESIDAVFAEYGFASVSLGLSQDIDYAALEAGADAKPIIERIRQGQVLIDRTKASVRESFRICMEGQPADGEVRRYAEVLARARLSELDRQRTTLVNRGFALAVLDGNRGKWRVEDGKVVFTDANAERLYGYCLEGAK